MTPDSTDIAPDLDGLEPLDVDESFHNKLCGMLDRVPLLREFEFSEIEDLAGYCHACKAAKGTLIFREGEKGNFMYLLVDGYVALMKGDKQLATVREGRAMGEMSMLDGSAYSATAISAVESTFIRISRKQFELLRREHPQVAFNLLLAISRLLSRRLRQTTDLLVDCL